jgi:glycosyltransferase involved in cell wall biosynthesis
VGVSIVVPCYRSGHSLPVLVSRIGVVMSTVDIPYETVLVVDGGPDSTWEMARELARTELFVRAMRLARNYGQHNALLAGVRAARFDVVVTMDDDLQHPPEEIPTLLAALSPGVDLVYGVPRGQAHSRLRGWASQLVKALMTSSLGVANARRLSAFRAFRSFLRDGFSLVHGAHVSVDVALSWGTTRVAWVDVQMDRRSSGRSGYTFRSLVRHTATMVVGYSTTPLRVVTYLGLAVGIGGLGLFAHVLWQYFSGSTTVAGFTTITAMTALFSSAQMVAIGVLGEYVGRIHANGIGRPSYVVRDSTDMSKTLH